MDIQESWTTVAGGNRYLPRAFRVVTGMKRCMFAVVSTMLASTVVFAVLTLAPARPAGASTTGWAQLSPAMSPSSGFAASMAYDTATSQMVFFGDDGHTWTWNGTTWTQQSRPPARRPAPPPWPTTRPPASWSSSAASRRHSARQ